MAGSSHSKREQQGTPFGMNHDHEMRFTHERFLQRSESHPLLVLAYSLLVLVSFARAGVTQCSPPCRVDVYLKPGPH